MKVTTQNKQIADIRRGVMELYISDHPLDCLTCPANGLRELQDMAGVVGLREVRYGYERANHLSAEKDTSNPISPSMPASASSVRAVCAPAMSSRGPSRGLARLADLHSPASYEDDKLHITARRESTMFVVAQPRAAQSSCPRTRQSRLRTSRTRQLGAADPASAVATKCSRVPLCGQTR
jgi:NADH-ubiquinone oxidoreductase-G iron-sulfur binding region